MTKLIKTFADFVFEMIHYREEIIETFEISEEVFQRWASGKHLPNPVLRASVWSFLNELQARDMGWGKDKNKKIQEIVDIINQYDPMGLLKMGAPLDEYETEAECILHSLRLESTLHDFRLAVWAIFVTKFSVESAGSSMHYIEMSEKIWNLKKEKYEKKNEETQVEEIKIQQAPETAPEENN